MENKDRLNKINKEIKIFINESSFISQKCRNKLISMLLDEFSIDVDSLDYAKIDVVLLEDGSFLIRGEEYKQKNELTLDEVCEKFASFREKALEILNKKEVNYYDKGKKNNIINLVIVLFLLMIGVFLFIYAVKSFFYGNFFNSISLLFFIAIWFLPSIRDRVSQAINFIKRKRRK